MNPRILLASTSRYRAQLLHRLLPDFGQAAPDADETPLPGEAPDTRAMRLAQLKARSLIAAHAGNLIIGSDQVASLDGKLLRKPGDAATARAQLARSSSRQVLFHTALAVVDTDGAMHTHLDTTRVQFRALDEATIARYIEAEQPLDCAGSFKCEGLGIALFEHIDNTDPTALIGLPLIATARLLRECGVTLP
ncbi:MAG TPA: nucleoside triphosphate pyrophosphatase [Rhodanobacteraceae bacterium]